MPRNFAISSLIGLVVLLVAGQLQARIFQKVDVSKGMEARVDTIPGTRIRSAAITSPRCWTRGRSRSGLARVPTVST